MSNDVAIDGHVERIKKLISFLDISFLLRPRA